MKRLFSCFLFQARPLQSLSRGRRSLFWIWQFLWLAFSCVGIAFVSLLLAVGQYPLTYMQGYFDCPLILLLNVLPVACLGLLLYGLTRRPALSYLLTALLVIGLSVANFFKLMFRDDPLLAEDFAVVREAANMLGRYQLFISKKLGTCLAAAGLGLLFMLFFVRGRLPAKSRMSGVVVLLGSAGCLLSYALCTDSWIYENKTDYFESIDHRWSSTEQYIARGFIYPFLYSTNDAFEFAPDGYRASEAESILLSYEKTDIPEDKKVNIIGIMLEAYNDFSRFDVPGLKTEVVYGLWHQLEAESYSGDLVTNIFAGGTVDTERGFLTGFSKLPEFRAPTNSYAWYFRSQGYKVEGMHPSNEWFYNRRNINQNLGFENYLFTENYFAPLTDGWVGMDWIFIPELWNAYQTGAANGQPYFNFSVSYQGHGPYEDEKTLWAQLGYFVDNDGRYSTEEQTIMENYFGCQENTGRHLMALINALREDSKPVVVVLFGDHNPWMGDGNSIYKAMGIKFDLSDKEGFKDYYATRYVIWANNAAKEILGNDFQGEGPDLSPCFLMNEVFRLCGWSGPAYMQAIQEAADQVPVQSSATGRCFAAGAETDRLSPEEKAVVAEFDRIQYYYKNHFQYEYLQ